MNSKLKIIFAGTPEFGLPCLKHLAKQHNVIAVYTQPDRPAGRGRNLQASPIKIWAIDNLIPVYQPINFKDQSTVEKLKSLNADIMVVIAYGLILPASVLNIPQFGCINVHASILPRWRGSSPIQHAILSGDKKTGISIMQMDIGMDTGDYYTINSCDIENNETAKTLHDKLALLAVTPLLQTLDKIASNQAHAHKQDENLVTIAPKIKKEDAKINWHKPACEIERLIRAFNPWPLAFTEVANLRFQILKACEVSDNSHKNPGEIIQTNKDGILVATGQNCLLIEKIKLPGKNTIHIADYINTKAKQFQPGTILK